MHKTLLTVEATVRGEHSWLVDLRVYGCSNK